MSCPFDFKAWIRRHWRWSQNTFGPSDQRGPEGPIDHLRKEIEELAACPTDLEEVVDIIHLAVDASLRAGHSADDLFAALEAKQRKNFSRRWPDWRKAEPGKAIEHVRDDDAQ